MNVPNYFSSVCSQILLFFHTDQALAPPTGSHPILSLSLSLFFFLSGAHSFQGHWSDGTFESVKENLLI